MEETWDQRHRREYPEHYVWEKHTYPDMGLCHNELVCRFPIAVFNVTECELNIESNTLT